MHVHYRPSNEVLDYLQKVDFVAIVGPTAVGKNSVVEEAAKSSPDIRWTPFTTSRSPRTGEKQGVEYQFRSRQEMEERTARAEYVNVAPNLLGDLYASAPEDYKQQGINTAAVVADAIPTFRALPFKSFKVVFILPPSREVWQDRLKSRNFTADQSQKRMSEAKRSLLFALQSDDIFFVINDNLVQAGQDFSILVHDKSVSEKLEPSKDQANKIVGELLRNMEIAN